MNKLFLIAAFALIMAVSFAAPIANCVDATEETSCDECNPGYGRKSDGADPPNYTCEECTEDNCNNCDGTTPDVCTECDDGYGLVAGKCPKCTASNCQDCPTKVAECKTCNIGYTNVDTEGKAGTTCSACANGCKSCDQIDSSCAECPTGHAKNDANKDNVFCCANTNCTACATTTNCTACASGVNYNEDKGTCFGFKSGASLTLGAVLSVALFSLLF